MFITKKGEVNPIAVVVTLVICLAVGYLLIHFSSTGIKDAGDEFLGLLNLNTQNCDHDHDDVKDKDDLCPCDSNDFFNSKNYYIAEENDCEVKLRCMRFPLEERITGCTSKYNDNPALADVAMTQYYFLLSDKDCANWYEKKGSAAMAGCTEPPTDTIQVSFNDACAKKVLAWSAEKGRATFTCKTSTSKCKDILKKEC